MTRTSTQQQQLPFADPATPPAARAAPRLRAWLPEACLALAALVVLTVGLASVPLLDPDEPRYADASRGMLETGDLIVPRFNGHERINKPVLFYWLQAAAMTTIGPAEAAARAPSVAAALLVLAAVYLFARRESGRQCALRASAILLTCPLFAVVGKTGITDMLLCLFVLLALVFWYRSYRGRGNPRLQWIAASLSFGLAFLAKGPVGLLLPAAIIALFLALRGDWSAFRLRGTLLGALLAAGVFTPWALLLVHRLGSAPGSALLDTMERGAKRVLDLLTVETIERSLHGLDHPEPIFYLAAASFIVFFPWAFFFPFALARLLPELRRREPGILFLVTWSLAVLLIFSILRGKLVTYILPMAPPLAMILGREWTALGEKNLPSKRGTWAIAGCATVTCALSGLVGYALAARPDWLDGHSKLLLALAGLTLAAAILPLLARRVEFADIPLAIAMAVALVAVPIAAGGEIGARRSLRALAAEAGIGERPWSGVIAYKLYRPSLPFYGRRIVTMAQEPRELAAALDAGSLVVIEESKFRKLPRAWRDAFTVVAAQGAVLAVSPITPLPPLRPARQRSEEGAR